ncbi:hypothetical protein pb186bvf_004392 [Paramecium bursaria]
MQLYSYLFSIPEINQIIINQINQENMGFHQQQISKTNIILICDQADIIRIIYSIIESSELNWIQVVFSMTVDYFQQINFVED